MSLSGRIEDLPLLDIVQIVAFTQRTGYIRVETEVGIGAIVFRNGRVVACFSPGSSERVPRTGLAPSEWEKRLTAGIAADLGALSRLRDGNFGFVLSNEVPKQIEGYSLERETLTVGVDAQELLLDLARELDESRRDAATALAAPEAAPVLDTPAAPVMAAEVKASVLVVDDEPDVRAFLMKRLVENGYEDVVGAATLESALQLAQQMGRAGATFLAVVDLSIPDPTGGDLSGGLELTMRLRGFANAPRVVLVTPDPEPNIVRKGRQAGARRVVFRPTLGRLNKDLFERHLDTFATKLLTVLQQVVDGKPHGSVASASPIGLIDGLDLLGCIGESVGIRDLLLRVASGMVERVILLIRSEDILYPASGVGFPLGPMGFDLTLSAYTSPFAEALQGRAAQSFVTDAPFWREMSALSILRGRSLEAALIPLRAHGDAVALLFVDNPISGEALTRLDPLEAFVEEAGRRLEELRDQELSKTGTIKRVTIPR
ncbi:MAG: response regulator [Vicinamibacteria bacterium]